MQKRDVEVGGYYIMRISGKLRPVRIMAHDPRGGWIVENLATKRMFWVTHGGRFRRKATPREIENPNMEILLEPAE